MCIGLEASPSPLSLSLPSSLPGQSSTSAGSSISTKSLSLSHALLTSQFTLIVLVSVSGADIDRTRGDDIGVSSGTP